MKRALFFRILIQLAILEDSDVIFLPKYFPTFIVSLSDPQDPLPISELVCADFGSPQDLFDAFDVAITPPDMLDTFEDSFDTVVDLRGEFAHAAHSVCPVAMTGSGW